MRLDMCSETGTPLGRFLLHLGAVVSEYRSVDNYGGSSESVDMPSLEFMKEGLLGWLVGEMVRRFSLWHLELTEL